VKTDPVAALALHFALLSLIAVGGVDTVLPDIHRFVVDEHGWVTDGRFADFFAIARAAPGPNVLFVTLLGWHVAGLSGALVATAAICGPACVLTFAVARLWHRFRHSPWRLAIQAGLAPITVGLVLASGYVVTRAAGQTWAALAVTGATAVIVLATKIHPLWMLAGAAALGVLGLV
jgi:chromate transporter